MLKKVTFVEKFIIEDMQKWQFKAQVIIISYKHKECWIFYPFVKSIKNHTIANLINSSLSC